MLRTTQDNLACQLLKLEQQLKAYEKLHADELAEMWSILNVCKQAMADIASADEPGDPDACSLENILADSHEQRANRG